MKTKKMLIVLIVVIFSLVFVSCSGPTGEGNGGAATVDQANNALADGDVSTAKEVYGEVLQEEPNNLEANAGYAIAESAEQIENIATVMEQLNGMNASSAASRDINAYTDFWNDIDFEEMQMTLADEIIPVLEDAKEKLEYVLDNIDRLGNHTLKFYPNKHDWNNDRLKSATQPLNFSFEPYENSSETRVWWVMFNAPDGAVINEEVFYELLLDQLFDSGKRGDAWFDKETFEQIAANGSLPDGYTPTFDNNDYIEVNENEIKLLLTMINAQLMMLEPLVVYDLVPDQGVPSSLDDIFSGNFATALTALGDIDSDNDGVISNTEIQVLLGDSFLTFLDHDEGGQNAVTDWEDAILDFVTLGTYLAGEEGYDLENQQMIIDFLSQLEAYVTDTAEKIELPNLIDDDEGSEYLIIAAFFENPTNFSNLKVFLPAVTYPTQITSPQFEIIFDDPTFGGLIEGFTATYTINFQDLMTIITF